MPSLTDGKAKALDAIFYDDFHSPETVKENGGQLLGTTPIPIHGYVDFTESANQIIRYPQQKLRPAYGGAFTIIAKIQFKSVPVSEHFMFGVDVSSGGAAFKVVFYNNAATTNMNVGLRFPVAGVTYATLGNIGLTETVVAVTFDRNGAAGAKIKTYRGKTLVASTSSISENITQPVYGIEVGSTNVSPFIIKYILVSSRAWSQQEINDWVDETTFNYEKDCVLFCPMHDKIGSAAPYTTSDLSRTKATVTLGDGATGTTFPTKLTSRNGFSFDGGDYLSTNFASAADIWAVEVFWMPKTTTIQYVVGVRATEQKGLGYINSGGFQRMAWYNGAALVLGAQMHNPGSLLHNLLIKNAANYTLYTNGKLDFGPSASTNELLNNVYFGRRGDALPITGNIYKSAIYTGRELTLTHAKDLYYKSSLWVPGTYQM